MRRIRTLFILATAAASIIMLAQPSAAQMVVTSQELQNYARALTQIEPLRQSAVASIQSRLRQRSVPPLQCTDLSKLPVSDNNVRNIVWHYCRQSFQVIQRNGLNHIRFQEITEAQAENPGLRMMIWNQMRRFRP
jgi:hypothetical protein